MNIDYKLIGSRISKIRKSKGMTQENMAEKLNVSVGYVSQVERGITKISLDLLGKISAILDCDIAVFLSESVVIKDDYMNAEYLKDFNNLGFKEKQLVTDFIKMIKDKKYF